VIRIGIDLGGTKIEGVALDVDGGVLLRERVATPRDDYVATLEAIAGLVASFEAQLGVAATVGVGTPGSASPATGRMRNCNSTWLNGKALREDLCVRLGRDVRIANDADCFALSEATDGAGAGAGTVFGVILGTGVGGGVCVDGRLLAGPNAIAGEWGHNRFAGPRGPFADARECYCGRTDCIESWLSGPALLRSHLAARSNPPARINLAGPINPTVGPNSFGQLGSDDAEAPADAAGVVALAGQGDPPARATLDLYVSQLAFALAQVINVLDPQVIVLGGGLSNIARLYEEVPARWSDYVFSDVVRTRLMPARFGDSSGVRGAAWLFPLLP